MYRASEDALRGRLEISERARLAEERRARAAQTALVDATTRLNRLRDGVSETDDLDGQGISRALGWSLHGIGLVGILAAVAGAFTFAASYFPELSLSSGGLRNAAWIVRHRQGLVGLGGGVAIFMLAAPWAVLPFAGAWGVAARRRWGWLVAVVAAGLWLPTPLLPISMMALLRLFDVRTRGVFFREGRS